MLLGTAAAFSATPAFGATNVEQDVFLVDITGSMQELSTKTSTKWEEARKLIVSRLAEIALRDTEAQKSGTTLEHHFELRVLKNSPEFNGTKIVIPFSANATGADVLAKLDTLGPEWGASTPLAGTMCDAMEGMFAHEGEIMDAGGDFTFKFLYVISDGLENSTPTVATPNCGEACIQCAGDLLDESYLADPQNTGIDPTTFPINTWAYKVFSMAARGIIPDPENPTDVVQTPASRYMVLNVDMLFDFIDSSSSAVSSVDPAAEFNTANPGLYAANGNYSLDIVTPAWEKYFGLIANWGNGRYRSVKANATGTAVVYATPSGMLGDITHDGCVGVVDYQKLMQVYNKPVIPTNEVTQASDLDQSFVVNYKDYRVLMANYGKGNCNTNGRTGDL
jgi:hypothetical protein